MPTHEHNRWESKYIPGDEMQGDAFNKGKNGYDLRVIEVEMWWDFWVTSQILKSSPSQSKFCDLDCTIMMARVPRLR